MSISDGLSPYNFRRKMEKTRPIRERMDEKCLFPARVGIFPFLVDMFELLFSISTLTWRVNNYVSRQEKGINRRNESTNIS